ncbi:hypothetical protein H9Q70_013612 [Fusarium xylarioides]|nr:hypothetical protein H9Q70_013612 [Fusarium xylarioides]KAG5768997.1 hypothetical protein H9Q73_013678 [Fusarium xylarioides]
MATVVYSIESCIQHFFNQTTATRAECDAMAASLVGEPVNPVPVQGMWSYTVIAGPDQADIVQFRAEPSKLNMANVDIAMLVHQTCVPRCTYHGMIGGRSPLYIYVMEKRNGACYIQARDMSKEGKFEFETRQLRTVGDLARFFAEAWKSPQQVPLTFVNNLRRDLETDLNRLHQQLPNRFKDALNQVLKHLPRIFNMPFVITHGDLNEMNILVDDSGYITGVIDWAESEFCPFGISLWALENILGHMDAMGWHYHDNSKELREEFWRVFEISIGPLQGGGADGTVQV